MYPSDRTLDIDGLQAGPLLTAEQLGGIQEWASRWAGSHSDVHRLLKDAQAARRLLALAASALAGAVQPMRGEVSLANQIMGEADPVTMAAMFRLAKVQVALNALRAAGIIVPPDTPEMQLA